MRCFKPLFVLLFLPLLLKDKAPLSTESKPAISIVRPIPAPISSSTQMERGGRKTQSRLPCHAGAAAGKQAKTRKNN